DEKKVKQEKPKGAAPKGDGKAAAPKGDGKGKGKETAAETKPAERIPPRLLERFRAEIAPTLMKEFGYSNIMQVPHLTKIVVNVGVGEALTNAKALDSAVRDITTITGQK